MVVHHRKEEIDAQSISGGVPPRRRGGRSQTRSSDHPDRQGLRHLAVMRWCWVQRAEIEEGVRDGLTLAEEAEIRELKKRNRLIEQENEVLRRAAVYLGKGVFPK